MQEFPNFENSPFVKNTFSKFSQNLSFYFRDLRKKKLLQITQKIIKKIGIGELIVVKQVLPS
jgi:hypothetical protein